MTTIGSVGALATRSVSAASSAAFRIGFGVVGLIFVIRFFARGWIDTLLLDPPYHFTYSGFEWVTPWPEPWMQIHFLVIGLAAIGIALGYRYRISTVVFALAVAYVELIDRALYLNHYYWLVLTAAVMAFLPLNAAYSIDARSGRVTGQGTVPAWTVWGLRFQVGMVYVFAGLAKVNGDWLLRGEPLATWLPARSELWLIGPALAVPATAYMMSWAGAFFDLTVVGWLSWPRARPFAYVTVVLFHLLTWLLFPAIGLFPLLMCLAALVYFDPAWPETLIGPIAAARPARVRRLRPVWLLIAACYAVVMIALPLRHYVLAGDVKWNGEGYLGSWQVMLSEKSGSAEFVVTDPGTGDTWRVPPPEYLTDRQLSVMATDPTMIRQTSQLIADEIGGVIVAADVKLSFNGRPSTQFTDPSVVISDRSSTVSTGEFVLAGP